MPVELIDWLRQQCADYRFDIGGVFRRDSAAASWPMAAADPASLERTLTENGHLLPLPLEPAALANVLEVSIVDFLEARALQVPGAVMSRGSERGYPDIEMTGEAFGGGVHAIDVKAARRNSSGKRTQSRITLYTGNTYFKHPKLHWPGVPRPFDEYRSHLDVILVYDLTPQTAARVGDLEVLVHEPWRIASKERSSTTREYIGAVMDLEDLRAGRGAFETPDASYRYWRAFNFKVSPQVQRQYERLHDAAMRELEGYRARRGQPPDGE